MDRRSAHAAAQMNQRAQVDIEPTPTDTSIHGEVPGDIPALTGQANRCLAQWAGERDARRASVARDVLSEVGAASCGSIRLNDADIARSAQDILQSITLLPAGCIGVVVDGGWITLSGSVHWKYQKEAAAAAVRHVIGVTGVTVRLTVADTGSAPATRSPFDPFAGRR